MVVVYFCFYHSFCYIIKNYNEYGSSSTSVNYVSLIPESDSFQRKGPILQIYKFLLKSGAILDIASCWNDKRCEINQKTIISKDKLLMSTFRVIYIYVRHDGRAQNVLYAHLK